MGNTELHRNRCTVASKRVTRPAPYIDFLDSLDTGLARKVKRCYKQGHHREILDVPMPVPSDYKSADLFRRDYCAYSLLRKADFLDTGIDTVQVAIDGYLAQERVNRETNLRIQRNFQAWLDTSKDESPLLSIGSYISKARKKISRVLGDFSWEKVLELMVFTSGSSVDHSYGHGDPYYKLSHNRLSVTRNLAPYAMSYVTNCPAWGSIMRRSYGCNPYDWFDIVDDEVMTAVEKDAGKGRIIKKQATMNMFFQKGVGRYIRNQLLKVGVNIRDQSFNQRLAKHGSLYGTIATLDLRSASDSITWQAIQSLIPSDWFAILDMMRHEHTAWSDVHGSHRLRNEMFSSMGNGFTFELETLIFWALSSSVRDVAHVVGKTGNVLDDISTSYGDDIIVPTTIAGEVTNLLQLFGFALNDLKSFATGPFRESCGKHYFHGEDVTPIYIKKPIDSRMRTYWWANSIRRFASRVHDGLFCDPRYMIAWQNVVATLKPNHRVFIPDGYGDGGLIGQLQEAGRIRRTPQGWYAVKHFLEQDVVPTINVDDCMYVRKLMFSQETTLFATDDEILDWTNQYMRLGRPVLRSVRGTVVQWADAPAWLQAS